MPRKPYNLKPMANSWDAALTDPQRWAIYAKFVEFRSDWTQVAGWVRGEYGIKEPSRSGLYRFADRMRRLESAHRLEQAIIARSEAGELARSAGQTDADLVAAYETLAADAALGMGDAKKAGLYTKMAMAIGDKIAEREKLRLKERQVAVAERSVQERVKSEREKAVDGLMDLAKGNDAATALLRQFLETLDKGQKAS
jgi:hypothetical protein